MRRILYLTYYYAPSGGSGVQRSVKLVRYLPQHGWHPTVVTVDPAAAAFPETDETLLADVPEDVHVARTPSWDPYAMYAALQGRSKADVVTTGFVGSASGGFKERLARWVRANLFVPDARLGWVPYAVRAARRLHAQQPFDALLTTGPPHSTHLAGWWLARKLGLPWVVDLRDPWTDIYYYHDLPRTGVARRWDEWLERAVLKRADARVTVGPSLAAHYEARSGLPVAVIPNGYDEADFADLPAEPRTKDAFVLAFVGTFVAQLNPDVLWDVLARLRQAGRIPALRLLLVGNIDAAVLEALRARGLDALTETRRYVAHPEAVRIMRRADALLLGINRISGGERIVTGKVFEYGRTGRPVVAIGPVGGDAARVLTETGAGRTFDWADAAGLEAEILRLYDAWAQGTPVAGAPLEAVRRYSRQQQAQALARLLDTLVEAPAP